MIDWTPWTTGPQADRWAALYEQALAWGSHPALSAEDERLLRPLELLALATQCLPAAALLLPGLLFRDEREARLRAEARRLAAKVARALQVHARDAGYRPGEWVAAAITATENDIMAVPEHLGSALAAGSALYASLPDRSRS